MGEAFITEESVAAIQTASNAGEPSSQQNCRQSKAWRRKALSGENAVQRIANRKREQARKSKISLWRRASRPKMDAGSCEGPGKMKNSVTFPEGTNEEFLTQNERDVTRKNC
jgi:hypothetical protein